MQKSKQRFIIRLYRQFDLDLIYLFDFYKRQNIEIQAQIKGILREYINGSDMGEPERILCENACHPYPVPTLSLKRKIQFHILLDYEKDKDIVEWIDTITLGYRNTCVKNIIRSHLGSPCLVPCLTTTEIEFFGKDAKCPEG